MAYTKRTDGRKFDELREMEAKVGIIKSADGSAMFRVGKTIAIAAVRGPRDLYPKFKQDSQKGVLRCNYDLMSFSVTERKRPGPSRRSQEISLVTEKALLPVLELDNFPNAVVDVFITIVQADAGTRCAGINAASLALADAGIPMKDLVCAVATGIINEDKVIVDVNKEEEDLEGGLADTPMAILPRSGEVTLLQMDGEASKEEILESIKLGKRACEQIYRVQRDALKERYGGMKDAAD
ncbi:MAG: exosome complex exonuclease Rrp41 [Candidatus Woesearchaeota archaeon]|nr:MAG: exosome complex exonuclease Rrp41 [Candidatus Woesearchaeota archaeon]